jgi:hypothetical protein
MRPWAQIAALGAWLATMPRGHAAPTTLSHIALGFADDTVHGGHLFDAALNLDLMAP